MKNISESCFPLYMDFLIWLCSYTSWQSDYVSCIRFMFSHSHRPHIYSCLYKWLKPQYLHCTYFLVLLRPSLFNSLCSCIPLGVSWSCLSPVKLIVHAVFHMDAILQRPDRYVALNPLRTIILSRINSSHNCLLVREIRLRKHQSSPIYLNLQVLNIYMSFIRITFLGGLQCSSNLSILFTI